MQQLLNTINMWYDNWISNPNTWVFTYFLLFTLISLFLISDTFQRLKEKIRVAYIIKAHEDKFTFLRDNLHYRIVMLICEHPITIYGNLSSYIGYTEDILKLVYTNEDIDMRYIKYGKPKEKDIEEFLDQGYSFETEEDLKHYIYLYNELVIAKKIGIKHTELNKVATIHIDNMERILSSMELSVSNYYEITKKFFNNRYTRYMKRLYLDKVANEDFLLVIKDIDLRKVFNVNVKGNL